MSDAILFPGQGSHQGVVREQIADVLPDLVARCDQLVGDDAFARAGESTRFAQPVIFCAGLARWTTLDPDDVVAFAGHSLGELTALAAAGAISFEDALELVVERGRLMGQAEGGGMVALRATLEQAEAIATASGTVVANDNCPGQLVLSGSEAAVRNALDAASEAGVRGMRLDVAGAFHSPLMEPAVGPFAGACEAVTWQTPARPVLRCATAEPFTDPAEELPRALTEPVRWTAVVRALDGLGTTRYTDVGPGRLVASLVRKTLKEAETLAVA